MHHPERVLPWAEVGTPLVGVSARRLPPWQRDASRRALEARIRILDGSDGPLDWATALWGNPTDADLDFILQGGLADKLVHIEAWKPWRGKFERAIALANLPSLEELGVELAHQLLRSVTRNMNAAVVRLAAEIVRREKTDE